jgi:hypothetical protein
VLAFVSETALALDSVSFRYLWEPVIDDQSPGWVDILALPPITISSEIATFAGGTFGGFPFAGTYAQIVIPTATVWVDIVNDQPPGWTPVNSSS